MSELRIKALELAVGGSVMSDSPARIVAHAQAFLDFLQGSTSAAAVATATTKVEKPAAAAAKVEPQAEAVTERPPVGGDAGQSTTSSTAPAASASQEAQPTPDAQAAEQSNPSPSAPDVKDVNAAVLAYNRKLGREATVAILAKFGGTKVPEIDSAKWAELLAELKAAVA